MNNITQKCRISVKGEQLKYSIIVIQIKAIVIRIVTLSFIHLIRIMFITFMLIKQINKRCKKRLRVIESMILENKIKYNGLKKVEKLVKTRIS